MSAILVFCLISVLPSDNPDPTAPRLVGDTGGVISLLGNAPVAKELKLTEPQIKAVRELFDKYLAKLTRYSFCV